MGCSGEHDVLCLAALRSLEGGEGWKIREDECSLGVFFCVSIVSF